jgi:hypothetical protein
VKIGRIEIVLAGNTAANWARGVLAAKNSFTAADAKIVERHLRSRVLGTRFRVLLTELRQTLTLTEL